MSYHKLQFAELFSASQERALVKQLLATHAPDGRSVDATFVLHIVNDILQLSKLTPFPSDVNHLDLDDKSHSRTGTLDSLAYIIHNVSCEINFKSSVHTDPHETAMCVLKTLSHYTWDAKLVVALAAFATSYGDFYLVSQLHGVNPMAKSLAALKQIPDIFHHVDALHPRLRVIDDLVSTMLDVAKCIIEFRDIPDEYVPGEIVVAIYWSIRSVVACSSQIAGLTGLGRDYIDATVSEEWELSGLAHKNRDILRHLQKELTQSRRHVDDKRHVEAYNTLVRLFETTHIDNMKILRALTYSKDDLALVDGHTKKHVSVEVLRRKVVMLFITDLNLSHEELLILVQIYNDTHQGRIERHYEILWLPVIDTNDPWTGEQEAIFDRLASSMPWYSLRHPSLLAQPMVRYIREGWNFERKPVLVVLDSQGKVASPNALHMMWIWGSLAFPFTSGREEALWKEETWRLEFLVDEIDPAILTWIKEDRYICLYGGEDVVWIRRFTTLLRRVFQDAKLPFEMLYVGKSNPKEHVKQAISAIAHEKMSSYWQDPVTIWFFWARLESMWHSKMQHGGSIAHDVIMQEVVTMLSLDSGDDGWAMISKGSTEIVKGRGKNVVECLLAFESWKEDVVEYGFVPAMRSSLKRMHTTEHCTRLVFPGDSRRMAKEEVVCVECGKPMEKFVLYRCCTD